MSLLLLYANCGKLSNRYCHWSVQHFMSITHCAVLKRLQPQYFFPFIVPHKSSYSVTRNAQTKNHLMGCKYSSSKATAPPHSSSPTTNSNPQHTLNGRIFGTSHVRLDRRTSWARTACYRQRGVFGHIVRVPASTGSWSARQCISGSMRSANFTFCQPTLPIVVILRWPSNKSKYISVGYVAVDVRLI